MCDNYCVFLILCWSFEITSFFKFFFKFLSGDHTYNGEETDGNRTFSEGEGDTSKATDTELASPKKEKKKKGLRTPSFLKKKKKDKDKEKDKDKKKA